MDREREDLGRFEENRWTFLKVVLCGRRERTQILEFCDKGFPASALRHAKANVEYFTKLGFELNWLAAVQYANPAIDEDCLRKHGSLLGLDTGEPSAQNWVMPQEGPKDAFERFETGLRALMAPPKATEVTRARIRPHSFAQSSVGEGGAVRLATL